MKFSLTFSDLTIDEARHLLNQAGGQAPVQPLPQAAPSNVGPVPQRPAPVPAGMPPGMPQAPRPAMPPGMPQGQVGPLPQPVQQPQPMQAPQPVQQQAQWTPQTVVPLMMAYGQKHGMERLTQLFVQNNMSTTLEDKTPEQLAWLAQVFQQG